MEIINESVRFTKTGESGRGKVTGYHQKPNPKMLNKGGKVDVSGLKKKQVPLLIDGDESKFTIGFEVEKNELSRGAVKEYELFCGFERDGSCGYEAVTHVLPLLPPSMWRTKVFDMMHKAERIIDDRFSPSDKRCGGHITVAVKGLSGERLLEMLRPISGVMLAMYRHRLVNVYCGANLRLEPCTQDIIYENNNARWTSTYDGIRRYNSNGYSQRYRVALPKGDCLEWRLPSRVTSVAQMMRRYEFFYEFVEYAMTAKKPNIKLFLHKVRPVLVRLYDGNIEMVDAVSEMSVYFQEFINTGKVHDKIKRYIKTM